MSETARMRRRGVEQHRLHLCQSCKHCCCVQARHPPELLLHTKCHKHTHTQNFEGITTEKVVPSGS